MPNVFEELRQKIQENYDRIKKSSQATGRLQKAALDLALNALDDAAKSVTEWNYFAITLEEYKIDFADKVSKLSDFSSKNAKKLNPSEAPVSLRNSPAWVEKRLSTLHGDNNRAMESVIDAVTLLNKVMENALNYLNAKNYSDKELKSKKVKERLALLQEMASEQQKFLDIATKQFNANKAVITKNWGKYADESKETASESEEMTSPLAAGDYVMELPDDVEPRQTKKSGCFSWFCCCCAPKPSKRELVINQDDSSERQPLLSNRK